MYNGGGRVHIEKDLVAAAATPLVLGILADGDLHGYAILKRVGELSDGRLQWTDGMLYPLLHRLERNGWVSARWDVSDAGRKRKHYTLTAAGREVLAQRQAQWDVVADALRQVWSSLQGPPPAEARA
ncbi:PadR family transcriptional regulator [Cellulomonas composti]|uniref:PadR family transcriptional regulator n=1 Tax=Cellulomonas composti TaxID=266130 RepID=A0A511J7S2_9CELL|nr:PadR family transcriptional regulator [Cellulomonas composti]